MKSIALDHPRLLGGSLWFGNTPFVYSSLARLQSASNPEASNLTQYTYDRNGNLTYDGLQQYTYDAWNRMMTAAHAYSDSGVHARLYMGDQESG